MAKAKRSKRHISQTPQAEEGRPGIVTFAAIMMFALAGFELIFALMEFWNAEWITRSVYGSFGGHLWIWGSFDVLVAALALFTGIDILRGGAFGQVMGLVLAGLSAIRWFFYLIAAPWLGVVIIAVDILIIYALVAHWEYFDRPSVSRAH